MRLTALCVCGTLLAFSSLFWTAADSDEADLLGDYGFGPCTATLRPEGPCRHGQDESMCPYIFSLPPLTVHLPKQLRELETIVKDLQKLKDNVDQLRKMCADCTVSQTERECAEQREIEHGELNEGTSRHEDETNWLNERYPERLKDYSQEIGTDRVKNEKNIGEDADTDSEKRTILEEKERKKWEAERESDKGVVKENENDETLKEVAENGGKSQTEGAKGKDKLGQATVPTAVGNERTVDIGRKKDVEKNNRERDTDRNKEKDGKGNLKGDREDRLESGKERKITSNIKNKKKTEESDHHVWRDKTKETEERIQTGEDRGGDGIKMSEDHEEHTNREREQHGEERKKEMEKGTKVERNNEKPKQTESIGRTEKEKTIKEGEVDEEEEEDRETGKEIKSDGEKTVQSVQRDSDGELASSKAIEGPDLVSISQAPYSTISLAPTPRHDSMDSKAITLTSSLPSPTVSSSASHLITGINEGVIITTDGLPTQSTGLGAAGTSDRSSPDSEARFRTTGTTTTTTTTLSTLGIPGQQVTSATTEFSSITSTRPGAGIQERVSSATAATTTATPHESFYTTTIPGVADHSRWAAKKNISSNTKPGVKPLPDRGPKPGEKHKPAVRPEAEQKLKNPKNDRKPDRAPLPDKKTKHDQKQRPSQQKPATDQKSKPGKDTRRVEISKPDQQPPPDNLPTAQNLPNIQTPKRDPEHTTDQNQLPIQKPKSHQKPILPVQRPTSHQRPQTVHGTGSDKDPLTEREPEPVEIPIINQNSKPEKELVHPLKTDKPDQKQKPHKKPNSEEKTKPDQRSTVNQYFTPVHEPEPGRSETASLPPKPNQKPVTKLMENSDENVSPEPKNVPNTTPGQRLTPDQYLIKPPDQKPKPSQKTPKINQKPKPGQTPRLNQKHPGLVTDQKTKPNVTPKADQTPQTNRGFKMTWPDQRPNLNPKSVPDETPESESNKTSKPRPLPGHRPPTRPTAKPGATPAQMPKPSEQLKPSPKTKTDSDPLQNSGTTSYGIQNFQTDMPPASGRVEQTADVTHSPGDTEFSPTKMKTITLGPKTSNSPETGPFPHRHTLPEGFTMSPNSRITSDLGPQTAGQPPSIPMTTRPSKIMRGILPSVIHSTSPGSTKPKQGPNTDSRLQTKILHNVDETVPRQTLEPDDMMLPVLFPNAQTTSTTGPHLRSTTPANSALDPLAAEASTPSARELRVKINQVAAFFNNSLGSNGRLSDRRPLERPEDNQGGSRPDGTDSKLTSLIPSQVTISKRDCSDHLHRGNTKSGVYLVTPDLRSRSFSVFCDMELNGGGWTLLQKRQDGSVSFNRTWAEYRSGFGELDGGEFWLGNNMIHLLTRDRDMVLRVELEDFDGLMEYAEYEQFRVGSERLRYRLTVGRYSGTAGDALRFSRSYDHNNRAFTTPDRDHDRYPSGNCGAYYSSGWWFDACMAANLNGRYYVGKYKGVRDGIFWGTWHNISTEYYPTNERQSFKTVRMMIRPKGFTP